MEVGIVDCELESHSIYCNDCFIKEKHIGHEVLYYSNALGFCDCGIKTTIKPEGFCDKHKGEYTNMEDLMAFIKTNKKDKNALYKLGENFYNATFIKNVIDVIGEKCKIYFQGDLKPLYFVNNNDEIGIVLPVRTY